MTPLQENLYLEATPNSTAAQVGLAFSTLSKEQLPNIVTLLTA